MPFVDTVMNTTELATLLLKVPPNVQQEIEVLEITVKRYFSHKKSHSALHPKFLSIKSKLV